MNSTDINEKSSGHDKTQKNVQGIKDEGITNDNNSSSFSFLSPDCVREYEVSGVEFIPPDTVLRTNSEKEKEPEPETTDNEVEALSNNKVDVEIEPDVKANHVAVQICSCSLIFNCFSPNR